MEARKLLKEYKRTILFFSALALYLVVLALRQSPFNSFEDDASWLLPSLAWDMSSLSWTEQLSRDVGERGALSLNMLLRLLYVLFDSWPVGYRLFGIFVHTACTFLTYVVFRICGTNRTISLWVSVCFFFCSLQFHAIFWIIGVQHILAVSSILATCIIANHIFRLYFCKYRNLKIWHSGLALTSLLMVGINRASVLISLFAFSLFFTYYALKMKGILNRAKKLSYGLRLYSFYIFGMLLIPAFSFYQVSRQGEGWQVVTAITNLGIPDSVMISIQNIYSLYAGLTLLLSLICILAWFSSSYAPRLARERFTNLCYFLGILGIAFSVFLFDKNLYVLPALLENLFFIPDINALDQRWAPIRSFGFDSMGLQIIVHTTLCLLLMLIFLYGKPKRNAERLLCTTLFFMVAVGLAYFNSLTNNPLNLTAIPSRYAYYFTPAIMLTTTHAVVRYLSLNSGSSSGLYPSSRINNFNFSLKWHCFFMIFVIINAMMINKRLDHSKVNPFLSTSFASYPSFLLAQSIASWINKSDHVGVVSINLSGLTANETHSLISAYIPPVSSIFYPLTFHTEAYLNQLLDRKVKLKLVTRDADIMLCGQKLCDRSLKPIAVTKFKCEGGRFSFDSPQSKNSFLSDGGIELKILKSLLIRESLNPPPNNYHLLATNSLLEQINSCADFNAVVSTPLQLNAIMSFWADKDFQYLVRKSKVSGAEVRDSAGRMFELKIEKGQIFEKQSGEHGRFADGSQIAWNNRTTWDRPSYLRNIPTQSYEIYPNRPDKTHAVTFGLVSKRILLPRQLDS